MLTDLGFPDETLIQDIATGFKLSGWMPDSNLFQKNVKSPTLTLEALQQSTESFNSKVRTQMQLRQDQVLETDTWNETEHELEQGWIWEDDSGQWDRKAVARRFGIRQGQKTRVIDDCTVCGLNLTVGTKEKFTLHSVDQMCSMIDHSLEMAAEPHCPILGRTYDLKSAYKQFGLCVEDRDLLRIAVNRPGYAEPVLVGLNALPVWGHWVSCWFPENFICNMVDWSFWPGHSLECLLRRLLHHNSWLNWNRARTGL